MAARLQHPVALDRQLCFALYGASMAMGRVYKPLLDRLGITFPQYLVLHVLWEQDGRTIGEIADRLALEPSTITPLVKRLAAARFVDRVRDPADERHVRVTLTGRGRSLEADGRCVAEDVFAKTGLSIAQTGELTEQLQSLRCTLSMHAADREGSPSARNERRSGPLQHGRDDEEERL